MKSRGSMLSRIWLKCFPSSKAAESDKSAPVRLERTDGTKRKAEGAARTPRSGIEMLEGRIAPATLVNPSTVTFVDQDGDKVTVQFSKAIFLQTGPDLQHTLDSVFKFSVGGITANGIDAGIPQQLQLIDLTKIPLFGTVENTKAPAAGVSITITAEKADTLKPGATEGEMVPGGDGTLDGDGFVNVGAILATHPTNSLYSFGLGKVTIDGDLGQIDAGGSKFAVGIEALQVKSLGAMANTQADTTANFESKIIGSLGSLTVLDDVKGAYVNVVNGSGTGNKAIGKIGNITIGGSLIGTAAVASSSDNTGLIQSATTIGAIQIGSGVVSNGNDNVVSDGIIGGGGKNSGTILAGGKIASITINGDLVGGGGEKSGLILSSGEIGSVKIGVGAVNHGILGGAGKNSGLLQAAGKIGSLTIDGDLRGGAGEGSGSIVASGGAGTIKIGLGSNDHGINGGTGKNSGILQVGGKTGSITLSGDLTGGTGDGSGTIVTSGEIGTIQLGLGVAGHGILGGAGKNSGAMLGSATIKNLQLNGDLLGGGGEGSGSINAGQINSLKLFGKIDVVESGTNFAGINSGQIHATFGLGTVSVTGNMEGGTRTGTGTIISEGNIGQVSIGGSIIGGGGPQSGGIQAMGKLGGATISGSIEGGSGLFSGFVQGDVEIGFVRIAGDLKGNPETAGDRGGIISSNGSIREVTIGGSLIGGKGEGSGSIFAGRSGNGILDKVKITKQVIGGEGISSGAIVSGDKIGSIAVLNTSVVDLPAVQGGKGRFSGSIYSEGTVGSVTIAGNVAGGEGVESGTVQSHGLLAKLSISGNLSGGIGAGSGSIISHDIWDSEIAGDLGKLTIGGILKAGTGASSGGIYADGNLTSINLGGIEVGTFQSGQAGTDSASIRTGLGDFHVGDAKSITVTGSLDGGGSSHTLVEVNGSLGSLSVVHGIKNGEIHVGANLGKLTVGTSGKHGIEAGLENVLVTAGGVAPASAKLATAIAAITVSGDVTNSQILAGYDLAGQATNADAQIGSVKVSGDWNASDLVAGIKAVNGEFGDDDDQAIEGGLANITSRIANVIIGGTVSGTNAPTDSTTDHFGFVAQDIGKVKIGGKTIAPNVASPSLPSDVTVREVASVI